MAVGRIRGKHTHWALVVLGLAATGCPGAAELENPGRFELFKEPDAPTSCDEELPAALQSGCDYRAAMTTYCARSGCHGPSFVAGLDLRLDPQLIARILEKPALHVISCGVGMPCIASQATCDLCTSCPENALLVNRQAPTESWLIKKMEPFVPGMTANLGIGCGEAMPSFNTHDIVRAFSDTDKACLIEFFTHVATSTPNPERFPCTPQVDGGATDGGMTDGGT